MVQIKNKLNENVCSDKREFLIDKCRNFCSNSTSERLKYNSPGKGEVLPVAESKEIRWPGFFISDCTQPALTLFRICRQTSDMKTQIYLLSILIFATVYSAQGSTNVSSVITSNQTWNMAGSPYFIPDSTLIPNGVKLTIMPGVKVFNKSVKGKLIVQGELQARGKSGSLVDFSIDSIIFRDSSGHYNPATGSGCMLDFCTMVADVTLTGSGVFFKKCKFRKAPGYYGMFKINRSGILSELTLDSCDVNKYYFATSRDYVSKPLWGDPIWPANEKFILKITNSIISESAFMIQGDLEMKSNVFTRIDSSHFFIVNRGLIQCNKITETTTLHLHIDKNDTGSFSFNTLDSVGVKEFKTTLNNVYGMLNVHASSPTPDFKIEYNNFLHLYQNAWWPNKPDFKLVLKLDSAQKSTFTYDVKKNYWGTINKSEIEGFILDANDSPQMNATVLYDDFLKQPVKMCLDIPGCQAYFYFGIDTTKPDEMLIIDASTGTDNQTNYYWTFGDGNVSTDSTPSHVYASAGKYILCLYIQNPDTTCKSEFCDTVDATKSGFKIKVWKDKNVGLSELGGVELAGVYPNPSNGSFNLHLQKMYFDDVQLGIYDEYGRIIWEQVIKPGCQIVAVQMPEGSDGLYFLRIRTSEGLSVKKMVIRR